MLRIVKLYKVRFSFVRYHFAIQDIFNFELLLKWMVCLIGYVFDYCYQMEIYFELIIIVLQ